MESTKGYYLVKLKDGVSSIEITREELMESNAEINRLRKIEEAAKNLLTNLLCSDDGPCPACSYWLYPYKHHDYCTLQILKKLLEKKDG